MPIYYLRRLIGRERSERANRHLGFVLAFVAGAINSGAFIVIERYTSHMTGVTSSIANGFATGNVKYALAGVGALVSFMGGAAFSEIVINWARNRGLQSEYALPLMIEAWILFFFAFVGEFFSHHMGFFVSVTVMILCFTMGLQNAIVTQISNAVIRTTHMTGIVTDVGVEFGRMLYWNRKVDKADKDYVKSNRGKLYLLGGLLVMFVIGGIVGALSFSVIGYYTTIPLAFLLMFMTLIPLIDDFRRRSRDLIR